MFNHNFFEMSKAFDFASGLGGLNLSMATDADDESFNSVTPRPAATRGSTRSSVTVSDVFVSPVSRLSTGVSVGGGSVNKSVSLLHLEDSQKYCSGRIGTGAARACVKPDCTIASHQLGKNIM